MNSQLPLPVEQKLTVLFRVEAGCLGPSGAELIDGFCRFAQHEAAIADAAVLIWTLIPRHDKSLAEIAYLIGDKQLTQTKAARYLAMLNRNLDDVEESLHTELDRLIEKYMGR